MNTKQKYIEALSQLINILDHEWESISIKAYGFWRNEGWHTQQLIGLELGCLVNGRTTIEIDSVKHELPEGTLYFTDLERPFKGHPSEFLLHYLNIDTSDPKLFKTLKECFKKLSTNCYLSKTGHWEDGFLSILTEINNSKPFNRHLQKCIILGILIQHYRSLDNDKITGHQSKSGIKYETTIDNIIKYINENHEKTIVLSSISKEYGLSPKYLNSIFKLATGNTIIHYLMKVRMEKAKRLLKFTTMKITDIALDAGFYDCQYFCKMFKKWVHMTPSEYRSGTE